MRQVMVRGSAGTVYLAGPLTWLDPVGYASLEDALLSLGLIEEPAGAAFRTAARKLRGVGFTVSSRWELAGGATGEEPLSTGGDERADQRGARASQRAALRDAELIAVLDGWFDVPGALDEAALFALVSRRPCLTVSQLLRSVRSTAVRAG